VPKEFRVRDRAISARKGATSCRSKVGKPSGRILFGKNLQGSGGEDTKAFVHGLMGEKDLRKDKGTAMTRSR